METSPQELDDSKQGGGGRRIWAQMIVIINPLASLLDLSGWEYNFSRWDQSRR